MAFILANGKQQYFDDSGNPLNGGRLWTMQPGPGVTVPKNTWTDAAETTLNANPIILNARGEAQVFWSGSYNVRLETAAGGLIYTVESIEAVSGSGGATGWTSSRSTQTALASQSVFVGIPAYVPGTDSLIISVNGLVLAQSDYTETSDTTVTFATPFVGGEQVDFLSGNWVTFGIGKINAVDNGAVAQEATGASFYFRRNANLVGGSPTYVNACVFADSFVLNAGETALEWAFLARMNNWATAGENVAAYMQGNKYAGAGSTWGAVIEAWEKTATNDPATGTIGLEIDIDCNGTDNGAPYGSRVGVDLAIRKSPGIGSPAAEVSWGYRIQNGGDVDSVVGRGFGFFPGMTCIHAFDASTANCLSTAFMMAQDQVLAFNGTATRAMLHNGGGYVLEDPTGAFAGQWAFNDSGALTVNTVQLLGARQTGWGAPTATLSRTAITNGDTLLQTINHLAALVTDLTAHGLIGA